MIKLSSVGLAIAVATASMLAGCQLYFGDHSSGNGSGVVTGTSGSASGSGGSASGSGSGAPGVECTSDAQCAAGCFCSDGTCTEGGFCKTDKDCGSGFTCNTARSSCEPTPACTKDADCAADQVCDTKSGTCNADPAGTCDGTVSCATAAPACPDNQVPLIKDGCFTGACRAISACAVAPVCTALQHQDDCTARAADCAPVFTGHDCHGTTCGVSDVDCTCSSYTFASCTAAGATNHIIVGN